MVWARPGWLTEPNEAAQGLTMAAARNFSWP